MMQMTTQSLELAFLQHIARYGCGAACIRKFQELVYFNYHMNARILPWRSTGNPYHVIVSEIMLQQTQVDRVISKYNEFIAAFPDFKTLANASIQDVLTVWQGLGYNRRALFLKRIAETVIEKYEGILPKTPAELVALPGIGQATAASIAAFAFNTPTVFIETNIRSVYIHYFFSDRTDISDNEIMPILEKTLDRKNSCTWYNALMDLGTRLKAAHANPSRRSRHHQVQSTFAGSNRQKRGRILKLLTEKNCISFKNLHQKLGIQSAYLHELLDQLESEGFLTQTNSTIKLQ